MRVNCSIQPVIPCGRARKGPRPSGFPRRAVRQPDPVLYAMLQLRLSEAGTQRKAKHTAPISSHPSSNTRASH